MVTKESLIKEFNYTVLNEIPLNNKCTIIVTKDTYDKCTFLVNSKGNYIQNSHFRWRTDEKLQDYIIKKLNEAKAREEAKEQKKMNLLLQAENVQVGDIFVSTYGYEANFCDFIQVTKKLNSSIKVRPVAKSRTYGDFMDGNGSPYTYSSAIKDKFTGPEVTKRLRGDTIAGNNGHRYYKWTGKPIEEYNNH